MKLPIFILFLTLCASCMSPPYIPETQQLKPGKLPVPNVAVDIPNLGSCTDSKDRTLSFNANYPVTVLVHGCNGSAGRFRSLAQLYAFHGQQAICYSYDDRDSLLDSSNKLITAVVALSKHTQNQTISIIGHSMGGLIARKAMEATEQSRLMQSDIPLSLTTVSAPLSGIKQARACGSKPLHWLSLGFIPASCWAVSGDNWYEITSASNFIRRPGVLLPSIQRYLKVVTNEQNTCRQKNSKGKCIESDYIFGLPEQYHSVIDNYAQVTNVQVDAGHVAIVGYKNVAPRKLLAILQQHGMLPPTPIERQAKLEQLLAELY